MISFFYPEKGRYLSLSDNKETRTALSREEACKILGVEEGSDIKVIDDKFWQLSKRARGISDEDERQKRIDELSYAYDVATGKEEARLKAKAEREASPKYLGKTKKEWKNFFFYTWYIYVIIIVAVIFGAYVLKTTVFKPKADLTFLSVGHMTCDFSVTEKILKDNGVNNPTTNFVDLAVPNEQGEKNDSYVEASVSAFFIANPDLMVMDEATIYWFSGYAADMTSYYDSLKGQISDDAYSKIIPVYSSEYEYEEQSLKYQEKMGMSVDYSELDEASKEVIMVGLMVKDTKFIEDMGYENLWPESEPSLVYSFGKKAAERDKAEEILTSIFRELS